MVLFSFSGSNDFAKPFPNFMASFTNLKSLFMFFNIKSCKYQGYEALNFAAN